MNVFFFFYKQKTAYEMRMSDWSSDVCSSDLRDAIYIFGFSRGAYSARVLAGFINAVGLMEPRNLNLLDYAYRAFKSVGSKQADDAFAEVRLYERILDTEPIGRAQVYTPITNAHPVSPLLLVNKQKIKHA